MKLSKYIKLHLPETDLSTAKNVIETYNRWKNLKRRSYCDICYKELSSEEQKYNLSEQAAMNFHLTCSEHLPYATMYNLHGVRQKLGLDDLEYPMDL
jgi:hypothetical protein